MGTKRMPRQKPGQSKQDYRTPVDFLDAVRRRFGPLEWDLAATARNSVVPGKCYTPRDNSLMRRWNRNSPRGWQWLNPPFSDIAPWAERAALAPSTGGSVLMLVPAAVGSNWWRDHVHKRAAVVFLNGRLTFRGQSDCYPKDCALLVYAPGARALPPGVYRENYAIWSWQKELVVKQKIGAAVEAFEQIASVV